MIRTIKRLSLLALTLGVCALVSKAQIVTTSPNPLQTTSSDIVLTYHAEQGNGELKGLASTEKVYAHIGVITNASANTADWKHVVTPWPSTTNQSQANTTKNELTYVSANTYTLNIGTLKEYFGLSDGEVVTHIALVFRNATGSKQGKTADGSDILVEVHQPGLAMNFTSDAPTRSMQATTINFSVNLTEAADITIKANGTAFASKSGATELTASYDINAVGDYTFEATATAGTRSVTKSITVGYISASSQATYPGGKPVMGAQEGADGTVTFCLAAPGKSTVVLVPSWDDYAVRNDNVMHYQDYDGQRYFWITVSGLDADTYYPYYFIVDGTKSVGDPYAHLVLDPYNDKYISSSVFPDMPKYPEGLSNIVMGVYCRNIDKYEWSDFEMPDKSKLIIYELLLRDFTGTEGKGNANGTLRAARAKIPYLVKLGVNAVELMPIMEFNGNNSWGYNTNFYMAPDKAYGTPKDYKDFIDDCHKNGIAVILDIVFNQSEGLHPWYQMYPIATNPFYNRTAPHDYSVLNDWKQDNPLVQQQWADALKYWLTAYNVDGFRFDLVKGLGNNDSYGSGTEAYNQSRIDNMKRLHAVINSVKPEAVHINECLSHVVQEETAYANDGQLCWMNLNWNSAQYAMGYPEESGHGTIDNFLSSTTGRPWGSTVPYAESHDETRMGYKFRMWAPASIKGDESVMCKRLASVGVQMLMTPGPKMIWQFGELGADEDYADAGGNQTYPKPVHWSYLNNEDRAAIYDTYSRLTWFRRNNPDLYSQSATFYTEGLGNKQNVTTARVMRLTQGGKEVIAFLNPNITGTATITAESSKITTSNSRMIACSKDFEPSLNVSGTTLSVNVPAHSYAVYATANCSGIEDADFAVEGEAMAYGAEGRIVILGEYTTAAVYNLSGVMMPSLEVPAGMYIVNVDGRATKVVVK